MNTGWLLLAALITWPIAATTVGIARSETAKDVAACILLAASAIIGAIVLGEQLTHPTSEFSYGAAWTAITCIAFCVIVLLLRTSNVVRTDALDLAAFLAFGVSGVITILFMFPAGGGQFHYIP
jgi:hypothetical protein